MNEMISGQIMPEEVQKPVDEKMLQRMTQTLQKYKAGKRSVETRVISAEQWWKMRNQTEALKESDKIPGGFTSSSAWLHNVIANKHADAVEALPEPNILPREAGDKQEAKMLSAIVPCVLEQNQFDSTWSDNAWRKCKTGTAVYKVTWDQSKLNGLGDISIECVDLLNVFWKPGVTDIQQSPYFFHTMLVDNEQLISEYPELDGKLKGNTVTISKFVYDDNVDTSEMSLVIDAYYRRRTTDGRAVLHYVKYVDGFLERPLFATENDPQFSDVGLYDHGLYPFVFDALYPVEGSPCGYGYVDIGKNPQIAIDKMQTAFIKNVMAGAVPRYFKREDGSINEKEFLDLENVLINVDGNLGDDTLKPVDYRALPSAYLNVLESSINELRETTGNTEASTGVSPSGVTAASAIAALQEASGKGSRDATLSAYRSFAKIVNIVIELIRQFYDMPRSFRIVGDMGAMDFVQYSNEGLQPQMVGEMEGKQLYRRPVFDIKVSAQKKNVYTKISQNELALQLYQAGFFNPQMVDQALVTIDMMEFDGRDDVMQQIARNGTLAQKLAQYQALAYQLAQMCRPDLAQGIAQDMGMQVQPSGGSADMKRVQTDATGSRKAEEHPAPRKAREQSANASQPDGGAVIQERA